MQNWIVEMAKRMLVHLPIRMLTKMGRAGVFAPRTRGWARAGAAIDEYRREQHAKQRKALKLDDLIAIAETELSSDAAGARNG